MWVAYLDCFSGISGDMFLGALVDAGVSPGVLVKAATALNVGAELEISRVNRSGISATKVDVIVNGQKDLPRQASGEGLEEHAGSDSPAHSHAHIGEQAHHHAHHHHRHQPTVQPTRGLAEIRKIIVQAGISESAKENAIAIFEKLAAAEAKIHNLPIEQIHFHEVGAVDAMVDIVGAAVGREALEVDELICSPLNVGGGTVACAHGRFPVPAPATLELLNQAPVYSSGIDGELVTPTGAAIVASLATRFGQFPAMKIRRTGYGAGSRDLPGHSNVLRITVGESLAQAQLNVADQEIAILESNLDDLNPQVFAYVMDRLFAAGALDVYGTPVHMKKNRPGMLLTVLGTPDRAAQLTEIIFAETTTLGVRRRQERRQVLARTWNTVSTPFGDVRIKVASLNGTITGYAAEYEDCRRAALEHRVPLKVVMQEALDEYLRSSREE